VTGPDAIHPFAGVHSDVYDARRALIPSTGKVSQMHPLPIESLSPSS